MNHSLIESQSTTTLIRDLSVLRALQVMPAALAATLLLFTGMERLIKSDGSIVVTEQEFRRIPDPVLEEPGPIEVFYQKPKPPEQVDIEPAPPEIEFTAAPKDTLSFIPPVFSAPPPTTPGVYFGDAPVATMLVQPAYPAAAANRGVEGYVDVEFDIAATGATENIRVIAAVPPKVFERETIKAVKRWKFQPVIRDGQPVPYLGMVHRVHFEMEKN